MDGTRRRLKSVIPFKDPPQLGKSREKERRGKSINARQHKGAKA